ncbi:MAG: pyruvate kinase [Spirochaetales bacterium]|nr:pyruvate kinase [Spirochaetales bacterium]
MNKIKIICTIGPASSRPEVLEKLIDAGMNVARLNFSHGTYDDHAKVIGHLKRIREERGKNIGILQDLSGPKIRVGNLPEGRIELAVNTEVRLVPGKEYRKTGDIHVIPVNYDHLLEDSSEGKMILLDDGYIELRIEKKEETSLLCRVIDGGLLKSHKGVNFPGQVLSNEIPTGKDLEDLRFGIEHSVDFVALSFVQKKENIERLRKEIMALGGKALVIAKLERDAALREMDSIIPASDAVMVARGDLGIECDLAMIPIYQKMIVRLCNLRSRPVIIATQMLESMISNPIPTRAEVTDVANAIYDGSDAIMLSAETAVGSYPVEAVTMMRKIANNVERNLWLDRGWVREEKLDYSINPSLIIAESICTSAEELDAKLIIANTMSGTTARLISMFRPRAKVIAMTPVMETYYQLSLVWGIETIFHTELNASFLDMIAKDEEILKRAGLVEKGDLVVVSAGLPHGIAGGTNVMKLHTIS